MGDEMTLYEGDTDYTTGGWVTALQEALTKAGHAPEGGVDGKFGWRTKAAVVAFQIEQRFGDRGGVVGNQTWAALMGRERDLPGTNNGPHGGLY
jgi:peptidoglycan hydrolase-like protein with peptidoglycan-binding domain